MIRILPLVIIIVALFYLCYDTVKRVEVVMFTFCQFCSMRHLANGDVVIKTRIEVGTLQVHVRWRHVTRPTAFLNGGVDFFSTKLIDFVCVL